MKLAHMKLLLNKRSLIFPVTPPTAALGQNVAKNCSFSFRLLLVSKFMFSYLRISKITCLTRGALGGSEYRNAAKN